MNAPPKGGHRRRTPPFTSEKRRELSFPASSPGRLLRSHRLLSFLGTLLHVYRIPLRLDAPLCLVFTIFCGESFCREPPAAASRSTIATRSIHNDRGTAPPSLPLFLSISRRDSAKYRALRHEHVRTIVRFGKRWASESHDSRCELYVPSIVFRAVLPLSTFYV